MPATAPKPESRLIFVRQARADKTKLTDIYTVKAGSFYGIDLGLVKWWPAWRRYCFFPDVATLFDARCLDEISQFCQHQTDFQKQDQVKRRALR